MSAQLWRNVVNYAVVIVLVAILLLIGILKTLNWDIVMVISGSMEPALPVGSALFLQPVEPEELAVGDIITYRNNEAPHSITHRITEIIDQGDTLAFKTKGDANDIPDHRAVPAAAISGRVFISIPHLGYLTRSREGLLLLIVIPGAVLIGDEIASIIRHGRRSRSDSKYAKSP